jgi:Sec-independent protein translocase protein TatA
MKKMYKIIKNLKNTVKDNPDKLATQGKQDEEKQNKNTIQYDKLATQGKQEEEKQNKNTTQYVLDTTHRQK